MQLMGELLLSTSEDQMLIYIFCQKVNKQGEPGWQVL